MNHPEDCDCPIHIKEDTTNVKYAAWAVIIFFVVMFALCGCTNAPSELSRFKAEAEAYCSRHDGWLEAWSERSGEFRFQCREFHYYKFTNDNFNAVEPLVR